METEILTLSSPWMEYYRKLEAMFQYDEDIHLVMDNDQPEIKIFVDNPVKADALAKLLPVEKEFGNVKLAITVIPADIEATKLNLLKWAFSGNPVLNYILPSDTPFGTFNYVVFSKEVVQYFNDNMRDLNGNTSTLYESLARDLFGEDADICYCTDAVDFEE